MLRAEETGQLSGGVDLLLSDANASTSRLEPSFQIAGIALTKEPAYVGSVTSISGNTLTFTAQEDLEGNTPDPFITGVFASGTVRATAVVAVDDGPITAINIDSGGSGFTVAPTVTIDDPDTGNDAAEGIAQLSGDAVGSITFAGTAGDNYSSANPPNVTVDSGKHFIRLTSGTNEGRSFLIASNTGTTVTVDATSLADGESDADAVFDAGDAVEIVRATTLGDAFGVSSAEVGLDGSYSAYRSDWVYLWDLEYGRYLSYFFNDGTGSKPEGWYYTGDFFATQPDNDVVIAPDEAFIIARRNANAPTLTFEGQLLLSDTQLKLPEADKRFLMTNPFAGGILLTELLPTDSVGASTSKFYPANNDEDGDLVYVLSNNSWSKFYHKTTNVLVTEVATCTAVRLNGTGGVASAYLAYPPMAECTISSTTNPAPGDANMTITTASSHSLQTGDIVTITGVKGYKTNDDNTMYVTADGNETATQGEALEIETSANGVWEVVSATSTTFVIPKSGNAEYKSGGSWNTGSGGAGYSGDATVYFIGSNNGTVAYNAKGTGTVVGGKVTAITSISAGGGYGTTDRPQALFSSGSWRESTDPNADAGNSMIPGGAGILISRHAANNGVETYLKAYNPAK